MVHYGVLAYGTGAQTGTYDTPYIILDPQNILSSVTKNSEYTFTFNYSNTYSYLSVCAIRTYGLA